MFEFWFYGVKDPQDPESWEPFNFHGTTYDFLEFCCQIARWYNAQVAGEFVSQLMSAKKDEIDFLRITDWNFEVEFADIISPTEAIQKKIVLHKIR